MRIGCIGLALLAHGQLGATPLEVKPLDVEQAWYLPGGESGAALVPGRLMEGDIEVPGLSSKEASLPGAWRGILSLDVYGTIGPGAGKLALEAIDPVSGEVFAKAEVRVTGQAPRAAWAPIVFLRAGRGGSHQGV